MSYNTEKKLKDLKSELARAEAVLDTPEYKAMKMELEEKIKQAMREEDETGYHDPILDYVPCEEQCVEELHWEISDLEWELADKRELDELNSCSKVVDSATGVVLSYVSHSSL